MQSSIKWSQYLAGFASAIGTFAFGTSFGWSSPVSSQLQSENEYFLLGSHEFDWVASIMNVGCLISSIFIGFLMNAIGRRGAMLSLVIPVTIGWALLIWAQNFQMMVAGRFLIGLAGSFTIAVPQYTSEIAEKEIRGSLGALSQLFFTLGVLFSYSVGVFTNVFWLNVICGIFPLIFAVIFSFIPESPYYLIYKSRNQSGLRSLKWLRNKDYDIITEAEEIKEQIMKQRNYETMPRNSPDETEDAGQYMIGNGAKSSLWESLTTPATKKGILIAFGLMFFFQMAGVNIVFFYTKDIFEAAGTNLSSNLSLIIFGLVQVFSTFLATIIVDKTGRRKLLLISTSVMSVGLSFLGAYFFLSVYDARYIVHMKWMPLTALSVYAFFFAIGMGTVSFVVLSEIFTYDVKAVVVPAALALFYLLSFVLTNTFKMITQAIGTGPTFWVFAAFTKIGSTFIYFVVPETKGKSLAEIQRILSNE